MFNTKLFHFFFVTNVMSCIFCVSFSMESKEYFTNKNHRDLTIRKPVLGDPVTNGSKPLFGYTHKGTDAIFALACNYPVLYYQRFVGSLRKSGFTEDIVLAVSPPIKMKPGVEAYLLEKHVLSYAFEVDCQGKDNCRFKDEFLGYPDPRPFRTFANMRYGLYEYWLQNYNPRSYILILDFRDTFFQADPFLPFGIINTRLVNYDLQLFAENYKVKWIGKCVYNSLWVGRCFSKEALAAIKHEAVICSGSTLGSYTGIDYYITTMLTWMDKIQCWKKGIESDQGYQNYLFYHGHFNISIGKAILNYQGNGVVNTIGAMNGFRVPKDQKGPLDTYWRIRDSDGYILNNDGSKTACVHQWDRFFGEIQPWLDITYLNIKGAKNLTAIYWKNEALREKRKQAKLKKQMEMGKKVELESVKGNRKKKQN